MITRSTNLQGLSQQVLDEKLRRDTALYDAVQLICHDWKAGTLSDADKASQEAALYSEYETWALSNGVYEEVSDEELNADLQESLLEVLGALDDGTIQSIAIQVINGMRAKNNLAPITLNEMLTRLMS